MIVDFRTSYLGLELCSPLVVAACPLTSELDVLKRIEEYGAGAAVLPSLFEEQLAPNPGCALVDVSRRQPSSASRTDAI